MHISLKHYFPLFKFRICSLITFSAVVGLIATSSDSVSISNIIFLILATMMASSAASAFNHLQCEDGKDTAICLWYWSDIVCYRHVHSRFSWCTAKDLWCCAES